MSQQPSSSVYGQLAGWSDPVGHILSAIDLLDNQAQFEQDTTSLYCAAPGNHASMSYFLAATVTHVTGANIDDFVVETQLIPQVDAIL